MPRSARSTCSKPRLIRPQNFPIVTSSTPSTFARYILKRTARAPATATKRKVSKNFRKVLADLRAAFIVNHDARIRELSDQLEELTKGEQPELDDAVEITEPARNNTHRLLLYFDANRTVPYLAAYGKEFPDPFFLILSSLGAVPKGKKPSADDWPGVREFVIKEVSWQVGGLSLKKAANMPSWPGIPGWAPTKLSAKPNWRGGRLGGRLKGPIGKIVNVADCTDIIRNVLAAGLRQSFLWPLRRCCWAWTRRYDYLSTIGHWSDNKNETGRVWSPQ